MGLINYLKEGMDVSWLGKIYREAGQGNGGLDWDFDRIPKEKAGIEFIFLPFQPSGINCCPSGSLDILSGKFSGCIMATFANAGGRFVCHVSTGEKQDCKDKWNLYKNNGTVSGVMEFRPSDAFTTAPRGKALYGIYGLITPDLKCYAIAVTLDGTKQYVTGVKQCKPIRLEESSKPKSDGVLGVPRKAALTPAIKAHTSLR